MGEVVYRFFISILPDILYILKYKQFYKIKNTSAATPINNNTPTILQNP